VEVSKVVPQFFYDVIARGVPGGALLIGITFALGDSVSVKDIVLSGITVTSAPTTSAILSLVLFAFFAYVIGHIVGPAGDWISKLKIVDDIFSDYLHVLRNCVDSGKSKLPKRVQEYLRTEIGENGENTNFEYMSILFIWSDWLRLRSADAGARIVKLRAEYRMLIGLSVVGAFTSIFHVMWVIVGETKLSISLIAISILVFCMGLIGYCKAYSTFQWGVINNYYAQKMIDRDLPDPESEV
jgi:hypothetical protein